MAGHARDHAVATFKQQPAAFTRLLLLRRLYRLYHLRSSTFIGGMLVPRPG